MSDYYLIPTLWLPTGKSNMFEVLETGKGVRIVSTNAKKANEAAKDYQKKLNNGELFDIEKVAKDKVSMSDVLAIPFYQARDYRKFWQWPCNKDAPEAN
jgi:hypothetical protein